jgi:hypothetical protein
MIINGGDKMEPTEITKERQDEIMYGLTEGYSGD